MPFIRVGAFVIGYDKAVIQFTSATISCISFYSGIVPQTTAQEEIKAPSELISLQDKHQLERLPAQIIGYVEFEAVHLVCNVT